MATAVTAGKPAPLKKKPVLAPHSKGVITRLTECKACVQMLAGSPELRTAQMNALWDSGAGDGVEHHHSPSYNDKPGLYMAGYGDKGVRTIRLVISGKPDETTLMAKNLIADLAEAERRIERPVEAVAKAMLDNVAPRNQPQPISRAYDPDVD